MLLLLFISLTTGRFGCNIRLVIFKRISQINFLSIYCEIVLWSMPQDLTDNNIG